MKRHGRYELKTLDLREDAFINPALAEKLIRGAIGLNRTIGDPAARN